MYSPKSSSGASKSSAMWISPLALPKRRGRLACLTGTSWTICRSSVVIKTTSPRTAASIKLDSRVVASSSLTWCMLLFTWLYLCAVSCIVKYSIAHGSGAQRCHRRNSPTASAKLSACASTTSTVLTRRSHHHDERQIVDVGVERADVPGQVERGVRLRLHSPRLTERSRPYLTPATSQAISTRLRFVPGHHPALNCTEYL